MNVSLSNLYSGLENFKFYSVFLKPLSPTAVILVRDLIGTSHLNNTLTLGDSVGERLTLEVILRY